jgi:hypothetical protein
MLTNILLPQSASLRLEEIVIEPEMIVLKVSTEVLEAVKFHNTTRYKFLGNGPKQNFRQNALSVRDHLQSGWLKDKSSQLQAFFE